MDSDSFCRLTSSGTSTAALAATVAPAPFSAVTRHTSACPSSPVWIVYSPDPLIATRSPLRSHWNVNAIGAVPVHEPLEQVSFCPAAWPPETTGELVFAGSTGTVVALLVALATPAAL